VMPDLWLACVQGAVMTARGDDDLDLYSGAIEAAERALEILRGPENAMRVGMIERYAGEAMHALARHDNDIQELRTAIDHYDRSLNGLTGEELRIERAEAFFRRGCAFNDIAHHEDDPRYSERAIASWDQALPLVSKKDE